MRIAIGSLTYPLPNGVTHSINTSIDGFIEAGHDVMLIAPNYGMGNVRPEHFLVPGSKISSNVIKLIGVQGKKELVFGFLAGRKIRRLTAQFQPDAYWLHQVTYAANTFERHVVNSGLPSVLTYHTALDYYGKIYAGAFGEQAMIMRSAHVANSVDRVIAPSTFIKEKLQKWGVEKPIQVIPTGIEPMEKSYSPAELRARFKIPEDHRILLFVGRVVKEKNITALLLMLHDLIKTNPKTTLVLIGPGDIEETTVEATELGIAKNVVLTGQMPQEETSQCYGGSDLFVFASQSETQGLVIGEAMIAGLPVAALISPIQPEVYPDEVAVVVRDEKKFASAVSELLNSPKRMTELSENGKKFVAEKFSKKGMIDKQISLFEKLVGQ